MDDRHGIEAQLRQAEAEIERLTRERDEARASAEMQRRVVADAQADVERLDAEADRLRGETARLRGEVERLRGELDAATVKQHPDFDRSVARSIRINTQEDRWQTWDEFEDALLEAFSQVRSAALRGEDVRDWAKDLSLGQKLRRAEGCAHGLDIANASEALRCLADLFVRDPTAFSQFWESWMRPAILRAQKECYDDGRLDAESPAEREGD